jgi:protein translocase SecG subunit
MGLCDLTSPFIPITSLLPPILDSLILRLEQENRDLQYSLLQKIMSTFFVIIFSIILILVSLFSVLIILMQRPSEDAGMGAALGSGAVTSIFGGEAGNVLHQWTIISTILFFTLSCLLSMLYMAREGKKGTVMDFIASPTISAGLSQEATERDDSPKEDGTEEGKAEAFPENSEELNEEI